jgi:outer membrane PBP1 activator LpoA protein
LLTACAGQPPAPDKDTTVAQVSPEQAYAAGDYAVAARLWQQKALSQTGVAAAASRVKSADAWLMADRSEQAETVLATIDKGELPAADRSLMDLALADLALRADRPDEAGQLLREAAMSLPASLRTRYEQLLRNLELMLSRPGSRDISALLAQMQKGTIYQPQEDLRLLQSLQSVPSSELALQAANPRGNQTVTGWLDLVLVIRRNLVNAEFLEQDILAWKGRFPHHYLSETNALDLWLLYRQQFKPPEKVAVLLPGSGRLEAAADALRDGIMSAYLDSPGGAEIFFLSTGESGELTASAYLEARDLGAQWIIGPLQKPEIETLLGLADLTTPVLALNDLPPGLITPPALYGQINGVSLAPDEETRALVQEIRKSGLQRAIILAPEGEWGEHIAQIFQDDFLQDNGQIVAYISYPEGENDHSLTLERMLRIDESKARKQELESILQMDLRFVPVRRNDIDVIFLVANPGQGRLLRPQLRFYDAGDIPVYAPGRIYAGKPDALRDQDLNGVRFPTTPLQLNLNSADSLAALASLRGGSFTALFALGQDAWDMLPWLGLMHQDPEFPFAGASGTYTAGSAGTMLREPAFAIFSQGIPTPLTPPQEPAFSEPAPLEPAPLEGPSPGAPTEQSTLP